MAIRPFKSLKKKNKKKKINDTAISKTEINSGNINKRELLTVVSLVMLLASTDKGANGV